MKAIRGCGWWAYLLVASLLWVPFSASAQQSSLELGPLTFGQSGQQALANFLDERVKCVETPYTHEGRSILSCTPVDPETTETFAQSLLVDGKVKMVRYLLAPGSGLAQIQGQLEEMYGSPVHSGEGERSQVQGLGFWEYDPGVGCVILSEVRPGGPGAPSPDQAPTRLRISAIDPSGGWVEVLPGDFTGCEQLRR